MGTRAALHDAHIKYNFHVVVDGITVAGFNRCSGIGYEIEEKEYREGNNPTAIRRLRRFTKVKDVVLETGASDDLSFYTWAEENAVYQRGGKSKRDVEVIQLDRNGNRIRSWVIEGCWVKEFDVGDFDASSNEARIEKLVLAGERLHIS